MTSVVDGGWDDLVKVAVLGTARLAGRFPDSAGPGAEGALDPLLALLDAVGPGPQRSPERAVLASAATLGVSRRAAVRPALIAEMPAPAAVLDGIPAPRTLVGLAPILLVDRNRSVLLEVVERCARRGVRLPVAALPEMLDLASARGAFGEALRLVVPAAAGARGRWLAARNETWRWLLTPEEVPDDLDGTWERGSAEERLGLLRLIRTVDPGRAAPLLERTWRADRAPDRVAFVDALTQGLSMTDEPFLEEVALQDRARDVRLAATRLLDRLPASRRGERMAERAVALLPRLGERGLVDEVPASWAADGIVVGNGKLSALVERVIASTPLDALGSDPGVGIARLRREGGRTHDGLLGALGRAALVQQRWDWAVALLDGAPQDAPSFDLVRHLPAAVAAPWLAVQLARASRQTASAYVGLAESVAGPWPGALVAELLRRMVEDLTSGRFVRPDELDRCRLIGQRADPSVLSRLVPDLAAVRAADPRLERAFREAHAVAALRLDAITAIDDAAAGR